MNRLQTLIRHLPALCFLAALPIALTWPLIGHFATDIPGHPGDNLAFLWNDWWMRDALASGASFFQTDRIFAPFGANLILHTHTALSSWFAAAVFARWPIVVAHNLVVLLTLALNGVAVYLLAWDRCRERLPATIAATIFAASPFLSAHLLGHVNLLSAWGLPLFTLFLLRVLERRSWSASVGAGVMVVLTGFSDYYYLVYCGALFVVIVGSRLVSIEWRRVRTATSLRRLLLGLLAIDGALIAAVVVSGGFTAEWLGVRISATRATNLLAAGWILLAVLAWGYVRPSLRRATQTPGRRPVRGVLPQLAVMAGVAAVGISPLLTRLWTLARSGEYVTPASSWRSGPGGVDLATLVMGNPWHGRFGSAVRVLYERMDINTVEGGAWLGVVPMLLIAFALVKHRGEGEARLWRWVGAVFFVWALGPWLRVAGFDTGLLLPQNLLAHMPLLSNARMPGRAMVVVFLSVAMLSALALSRLSTPRRQVWMSGALCAVLIDFVPLPFPLTRIETPALYTTLKALPPGMVCELPVGVRDGFGVTGDFDDHVLTYQMTHGHPIVGGFAARASPSIVTSYQEMPVLRSLLLLSAGQAIDPRDSARSATDASAALRNAGILYVVMDRTRASASLVDYVEKQLSLSSLAREGEREVYVVR